MLNIILCGGSGTRLWPLSRKMLPKQFVRMFSDNSLFQITIRRNKAFSDALMFVVGQDQYFLAVDQASQVEAGNYKALVEPVGRNTAPAVALACLSIDPEEIVLVTTSDHLIKNEQALADAVKIAKNLSQKDALVTFGIRPTYPETGFGYIQYQGNDVLSFKEKPSLDQAEKYCSQGGYLWNSGMFCFKAGVFLEELIKHRPDIHSTAKKAFESAKKCDETIRISHADMENIPSDSIDYAVMERSDKVKVVACDIGWSDLGSYDSMYDEFSTEDGDNAIVLRSAETPNPLCIDSKNNLVVADKRKIALVDVDDLHVVDTSDAVLIAKRGSSQLVKSVVDQLKLERSELTDIHRKVYRPWGWYDCLDVADRFKVKRIMVKPGASLSLQKHHHRAEHWIVVSGTAEVTRGGEVILITENQSTYIPLGEIHRLANPGTIPLEMIEVQSGSYLGEDDIVRLEDIYDRD